MHGLECLVSRPKNLHSAKNIIRIHISDLENVILKLWVWHLVNVRHSHKIFPQMNDPDPQNTKFMTLMHGPHFSFHLFG